MPLSITQKEDLEFIWHPFTHLLYADRSINIVRSEGAYYFDENNKSYLDAISSWWVNLHGHAHPYINAKVKEQLDTNEHSIFSGFTHPGAVELGKRIIEKLGMGEAKAFYSDNGSTAVEVALKMAIQYFANKGEERLTFIAFENAYHGDTFGSMSVGERNVFSTSFHKVLFEVKRIPLPKRDSIEDLMSILSSIKDKQTIAGFIYEPLIQGAGGMKTYSSTALDQLIEFFKNEGILCIADEVMTGFGRTGTFFASNHLKQKADIVCLSKGLSGGYLPLGMTVCKNYIQQAFIQKDKSKTFFHGHSYTANPLACSAALASLDLLERQDTQASIASITSKHLNFVKENVTHPAIESIRSIGTILAIDLKSKEESGYMNTAADFISDYFLMNGILLRPLGNVLYLIPPYCIKESELDFIYFHIKNFLHEYSKQ